MSITDKFSDWPLLLDGFLANGGKAPMETPTLTIDELGELHQPNAMLFFINVRDAKGPHGENYQCAVSASTYEPIIRSRQTSKYFTLPWEDIIALAVARGIDA